VPVGRGARDRRGREHHRRARLVLDHDRLAKALRQILRIDAHERTHARASGERHHDGDLLGRILLRVGRSRARGGGDGEGRGKRGVAERHGISPLAPRLRHGRAMRGTRLPL
jgi:hypothetical protein